MILSHLQKSIELDKKIKSKFGESVLDTETNKEISWNEVIVILRFGRQWASHPLFLKEQEICGGVPDEVFEIKEALIKGKIPVWIKTLTNK